MKVLQSIEEYNEAKQKYTAYESARDIYCKDHRTNGIPVEICNTFPFASEVDNDLRSALEVYEFINDIPEKYFLYIDEKTACATTWTGQNLGTVHFGKEYRDNFGGKRQPINVKAINGKLYHGIYYKSSGDFARVRLFKHQ